MRCVFIHLVISTASQQSCLAVTKSRIHNYIDTINLQHYCEVIHWPFTGHLNDDDIVCSYFQQDSATAHTACLSMMLLHSVFRDRLISKDNSHTLLQLKETIASLIRNITLTELSCVFANKTCRCMSTSMWEPFLTFVVT